jgi:malic enzyme
MVGVLVQDPPRVVVLAAAFAAVRAAGNRIRDQWVVIHGAGTAGIGIADMMTADHDPALVCSMS